MSMNACCIAGRMHLFEAILQESEIIDFFIHHKRSKKKTTIVKCVRKDKINHIFFLKTLTSGLPNGIYFDVFYSSLNYTVNRT